MTDFEPPTEIRGIDFSASSRDAGRKTWIAEATVDDGGLRIDRLADAATVLECDPDRGRVVGAIWDYDVEGRTTTRRRDESSEPVLDYGFELQIDAVLELVESQ